MRWLFYTFITLFSLGVLGLVGAVGAAMYMVSYYGRDLPDYAALKDYRPPVVTRFYAGDGRLMAEYAEEKRVFVPIDAMPPMVKNAFIAAEDQNFYTHAGVDYFAIVRAAMSNLKSAGTGKRPVGASTITQQVAKNFLLTNEVSLRRKIREAILAYRMERAMSKDRLLELYLNQIYLGQGSYGVAAAALDYFNKSLEELTVPEIAYLAALPKAPNNYHPTRKYDAAVSRRNWVLNRMESDGYITKEQENEAKETPLKTIERDPIETVDAPFFAEEVRREIVERYGDKVLYGGGLAVRTTIDPRLQDIAERTLRNGLMAYDRRWGWRGPVVQFKDLNDWAARLSALEPPAAMLPAWKLGIVLDAGTAQASLGFADGGRGTLPLAHASWARRKHKGGGLAPEVTAVSQAVRPGDVVMVEFAGDEKQPDVYALRQIPEVNGALIAIDPHTGRVLAMQGGWSHGQSEFNRATQAKRQPGSAFKPFVYLAALAKNFTPATLVLDAPFVIDQGPGLPKWRPSNYKDEYYGPTPVRVGVEKSRNLMTVRLAHFIGMETIIDTVKKFGVIDQMEPHLAHALGSGETTVMKLTTGYAQLVNGGKKITPTMVDRIQDRRGRTIFSHDTRACDGCGNLIEWESQATPAVPDTREQIADARHAYQMVSILEGVVQRGTGTKIKTLNRPLAGKTGTTNESRDAWFVGFSPDLVVGVYVGFDEPRSLGKRETGSSVSVPIFRDFMEEALKDKSPMPFRVPPGIRQVQINAATGARADIDDEKVIWESFLIGTEPTDKMYILDGSGINELNAMPAHTDYTSSADGDVPTDSYTGGNIFTPAPDNSGGTTLGTGGIY